MQTMGETLTKHQIILYLLWTPPNNYSPQLLKHTAKNLHNKNEHQRRQRIVLSANEL